LSELVATAALVRTDAPDADDPAAVVRVAGEVAITTDAALDVNISDPVVVSSITTPSAEVVGKLIDENGTERTVFRTFADPSASGDTQVVAAQGSGVRVRVLDYSIMAAAAVSVRFRSATTSICSLKACAANGGIAPGLNKHGWFQTAANEALNVNLSGNVAVGVDVVWCQAT
jgi:hypothetical protein